MTRFIKKLFLLAVLVLGFASQGQALVLSKSTERVTVSVITEFDFVMDKSSELLVKLEMKDGWHTYGNPAGEAAMPTKFEWSNSKIKLVSQSVAEEFNFMGFTQYGYDKVAYYKFKIPPEMQIFKLNMEWMACGFDECAPESMDFAFALLGSDGVLKKETVWDYENKQAMDSFVKVSAPAEDDSGLIMIVFMAFIGGIVLNFMPCIFPILSIKAISLVQNINKHRKARTEAIFYFIGVVVCFFIMASVLILLRLKGESVGWGFQLQSPTFVVLMIIIFFVIFLMLLDIVNVRNPFANSVGRISFVKQKLNAFVTGFFAVLIASPCTAPFMGIAIGYTLTKPIYIYYPVFLALSIGYALPFTLIGFFPKILSKVLPKPGKWMIILKRFFAIPVFLTCVWLVWVLYAQICVSVEKNGNVQWHSYTEAEVDAAIDTSKPVFINFTAKWCITCLANEKFVLNSKEFKDIAKEKNINLYKADWTLKDEIISRALAKYRRNSIPLYVYCEHRECVILPQLLSIEAIKEKIDFINKR